MENRKPDIQLLVRRLQEDDITAFNAIFNRYSSKLYNFSYGYLKSKEETEELVQEIFTKIWETRRNLKSEYSFESYLFTIAFNQIKKYFRSKCTEDKYRDYIKSHQEENSSVSSQANYTVLNELLNDLINKMPEKRKAVFIKSRFEGKNAGEIADEMAISKKTVENHLSAALKHLRQELTKEHFMGILFFFLYIS